LVENVVDRFFRYIKIDTQSQDDVDDFPSTQKQFDLAKLLVEELKTMGLTDAHVDENCYVYATLEANLSGSMSAREVPIIGLVAHMDTSPEAPGANIKPQVITYEGGDIVLPEDPKMVISPEKNPELNDYVGMKIITSDGTTLLAADDKCGLAEIMTALETMINDKSIPHGTVKVCFTPDEEVGKGVDKIDLKKFNPKIAYTMDGGEMGEIENETFNAAAATFTVKGYNVHPGYAKDKMVNSIKVATDIMAEVGAKPSPENTEGKEGYLHIHHLTGTVDETVVKILIRDHDSGLMEEKRQYLREIRDKYAEKHPKGEILLDIKEYYRNMKSVLDEYPYAIDNALEAVERAGLKPKLASIRGGTDGARLCFMGVPTPNVFGGGINFHSKKEFVPIPAMEGAVRTIIELLKIYVEKAH
jgi:tripeptide aminopeptidase